jgi:hypothetical protein
MAQRNQQSQHTNVPEMFQNISPQSVIVGAAAAAGAVLAGRWLYNNSDKVTMFLGDIADNLQEGWNETGYNSEADGGSAFAGTGDSSTLKRPPIAQTNSNRTGKRNIPVH